MNTPEYPTAVIINAWLEGGYLYAEASCPDCGQDAFHAEVPRSPRGTFTHDCPGGERSRYWLADPDRLLNVAIHSCPSD